MTTVVTCKFCCLLLTAHMFYSLMSTRINCFLFWLEDQWSSGFDFQVVACDSCFVGFLFFKLSLFSFPLYLLTSELLVFFLRCRIILIIILYFCFFVVVKCCQETSDSWVSSEQHPAWVWVLLARYRQTVSAIMFLSLKRSEQQQQTRPDQTPISDEYK